MLNKERERTESMGYLNEDKQNKCHTKFHLY